MLTIAGLMSISANAGWSTISWAMRIIVSTTEPTFFAGAVGDGGIDTITTGLGNDIVLGGHLGDVLNVGEGNNIVLGDDGAIIYTGLDFGGTNPGDDAVASDIDEIISRIEPMVEDLIERHTRQLALPIES